MAKLKYLRFGGDGLVDGRVTFYRLKRKDGTPGAELKADAPTTRQQVQPDGSVIDVIQPGTAILADHVYEPGEFILRKMAVIEEIEDGTTPEQPEPSAAHAAARRAVGVPAIADVRAVHERQPRAVEDDEGK